MTHPPFGEDTVADLYAQDAELRAFIEESSPHHPHYADYLRQRRQLLERLRALRDATPRGPKNLTLRHAA